jgi:hypothetical protein
MYDDLHSYVQLIAMLEARYYFRVFAVTLFRLELELQHSLPIPAKK